MEVSILNQNDLYLALLLDKTFESGLTCPRHEMAERHVVFVSVRVIVCLCVCVCLCVPRIVFFMVGFQNYLVQSGQDDVPRTRTMSLAPRSRLHSPRELCA